VTCREGEQAKDEFVLMLMHYPIDLKACLVAAVEDKVAIFLFLTLGDDREAGGTIQ
jgi:hypothetical protein